MSEEINKNILFKADGTYINGIGDRIIKKAEEIMTEFQKSPQELEHRCYIVAKNKDLKHPTPLLILTMVEKELKSEALGDIEKSPSGVFGLVIGCRTSISRNDNLQTVVRILTKDGEEILIRAMNERTNKNTGGKFYTDVGKVFEGLQLGSVVRITHIDKGQPYEGSTMISFFANKNYVTRSGEVVKGTEYELISKLDDPENSIARNIYNIVERKLIDNPGSGDWVEFVGKIIDKETSFKYWCECSTRPVEVDENAICRECGRTPDKSDYYHGTLQTYGDGKTGEEMMFTMGVNYVKEYDEWENKFAWIGGKLYVSKNGDVRIGVRRFILPFDEPFNYEQSKIFAERKRNDNDESEV